MNNQEFLRISEIITYAVYAALLMLAVLRYAWCKREVLPRIVKFFSYSKLVATTILFRVFYAALQSVLIYREWAGDAVAKSFLNQSLSDSAAEWFSRAMPWVFKSHYGYYVFYVIQHFWMRILLSWVIAWIFYKFLILLKKYQERFFEDGETELGYFTALLAAWPLFTIFVPLCFVFVIVVSLIRMIFFKEAYTTLGWPLLSASAVTMIAGPFLLALFGLTVLVI